MTLGICPALVIRPTLGISVQPLSCSRQALVTCPALGMCQALVTCQALGIRRALGIRPGQQ